MGSYKEDVFFDAYEFFDDMFDSEDCSTSGFGYDYWVGNMESVDFRRNKLLRFMGLSSRWLVERDRDRDTDRDEDCVDDFVGEIREDCNVVLDGKIGDASLGLSRQPSLSDWSSKGVDLVVKTGNWDDSGEDVVKRSFDFSAERLVESKGNLGSSRKEGETVGLLDRRKKVKKGWLQKLNVIARIADRHEESVSLKLGHTSSKGGAGTRPVHVHAHKKKSKELSSLYATQEFPAHNGSITIIKFSHDGRYLASAGEDSIVRVWEIVDDQDPRIYEIQGTDPSSFYFSTNQLSELAPIKVGKDKTHKIKGLRKSSELACVILPPKVFRILEKPVHDFHGHGGEILSISWSRRGYLLSASVDKTVRMWKLGHHECLKIFTHNNYVTCVEFNPVDDNYFISGSIDGKVRIWDVHSCQVIDWIDLGDIVTAVCYNPDGKGSIVGTLDGKCSFYDIIDDRLQLHTQIFSLSKKKWPKRITGFQFCPIDSRKVIVSSADSQVRILYGVNLVGKFKGNRSSGSQMSACFTSDGKHIISAADDSNVYVWNHVSPDKLIAKPKSNTSYENFLSQNATMAIPWCGIKSIAAALPSPRSSLNNSNNNIALPRSTIDSPRMQSPSTNRGFFLESLLKGPQTWPAETLPDSNQVSVSPSMRKSEYKFLKSAYQSTFVAPHMWGLVIVAAGWDGRIRTYLNYGLPIRM
ncbi:dynein regulator LIS1 [Artemisia annua]|uniref:Dynein regulator LIS1 n=1 Tax=Artemisia annua TaxID=35608 RepID=A0A2U1MRV4_ARTAN|nr:dynein regulator LIS1 [Artemisia annua]